MLQIKCCTIENVQLTEDCWRLLLAAPQIATKTKPGQFVNVKICEINYPLFRRPFSITRSTKVDEGIRAIELVYRVVGKGTELMTRLKKGDELDIIGPLGHGFEWHKDKKIHVLVAGGVGSAGLFMLGEVLSKAKNKYGLELYVLLGARTAKDLILRVEFEMLGAKVLVSTDDGTLGYKGFVTEMLQDSIGKGEIPSDCVVYACGPETMYKALAPVCNHYNIPAQVALERRMLCGIGACLVCVCKIRKSNSLKYSRNLKSSHIQFDSVQDSGYALVCKDGPVFNIEEVIFDA